jgi:hypothetical protein
MTASNSTDPKTEVASGSPSVSTEQSEIDRIMKEIGELQGQMSAVGPSVEAPAAIESPKESEAIPPPPPGSVEDLKVEASISPQSEKPIEAPKVTDLFKEIAGGEASLLAETFAGLPDNSLESSLKEVPPVEKAPVKKRAPKPVVEELESESILKTVLQSSLSYVESKEIEFAPEVVKSSPSNDPNFTHLPNLPKVATQMAASQKENSNSVNSLSMTVTGQMSLKLNFDYEGQEVLVHFNTDVIHIQFSDGTEFKIPVKRNQSKKAA